MRPSSFEFAPVVADLDAYADDAGEYDLDGFENNSVDDALNVGFMVLTVTEVGDGFAHKVRFTPSGSITGDFVILGTSQTGAVIGETLESATGDPVTTVNKYLTLTSIETPVGIGAETVDIGWIQDAAEFTLLVTTPTDGLPHRVVITPSGSVSGSYTLTGTDSYGNALTETLATNAGSAVTSTAFFKTLTSVISAVIGAETVDIGWSGAVGGTIYPVDRHSPYAANIAVVVTGTINYTIQQTFSPIFDVAFQDVSWIDISALAAKTTSIASQASVGATAIRAVINSFSSGGSIEVFTNQPIAI